MFQVVTVLKISSQPVTSTSRNTRGADNDRLHCCCRLAKLAHVGYSLFVAMGCEMPPNLPLPLGVLAQLMVVPDRLANRPATTLYLCCMA